MIEAFDLEAFRNKVSQKMGLYFDDQRLSYLREALETGMAACNVKQAQDYFERLEEGLESKSLWSKLAEQLTVNETYFFRYAEHFKAFRDVVLGSWEQKRQKLGQREFRLLSAACSSGEEPYSLAILVKEWLQRQPENVKVSLWAIDINASALGRAKKGLYSSWSLRDLDAEIQEKYFATEGRDFRLDASIKSMVNFEEKNLLDADSLFWRPASFDAVFFRNALMYFSPEAARKVVSKISSSMSSSSYLFLGHAETLRGLSDDFHLKHSHEVFYYQLREAPRHIASSSFVEESAPRVELPQDLLLASGSWVDIIQNASQRIDALSKKSAEERNSEARAAAVEAPPPEKIDLSLLTRYMAQEKFGDAMALLQSSPRDGAEDAETQLLRAVLLTNAGQSKAAKELCSSLLEKDEMNAGARYLMALCLEKEGNAKGAIEEDQAAIYLDPSFAMPRLHLGLIARRSSRTQEAQIELQEARRLLAQEDPARILLFGGGFHRQGLMELCQNELRSIEAVHG